MFNENMESLKKLLCTQEYYTSIGSLMTWDLWMGQPVESSSYMQDISDFLIKESILKLTNDESKYLVEYFKNYDVDGIENLYQKSTIKQFIKKYEKTIKIPINLQLEIKNTTKDAQIVWEEAYKKSDYDMFKPYLNKIFELKTKEAEYIDNSKNPFDVLVESFDEGVKVEKISKLFDELKIAVVELTNKIVSSGKNYELEEINVCHDRKLSEELMLDIIKKVGYNPNRNMWGLKLHPVTMLIGPRDSRITSNFRSFKGSMFSFLHEIGHGIYNCTSNDEAIEYSLWGGTCGSLHESQSRFYETIIGKSREFWTCFYPFVQSKIKEFANIDFETFYKGINNVKPSIKRLDADELTYNLHPIIRFEIEKDYFDGKIKIDEIREVWNERYKAYLGIEPKNDAEGVLQDIHWAQGLIGYFQSYTLGDIYDGQILNTLLKGNPDVFKQISKGNFTPLSDWLYENIHQYGKLYTLDGMIKNVTNEEIQVKYYINYLNKKFNDLYRLN